MLALGEIKIEFAELLIFLSINIFLAVLAIVKKAGLPSVVGLIISLSALTFAQGGVVLERIAIVNQTSGVVSYQTISATASITILVFIMLAIIHFIIILGCVRSV